MHALVAEAMKKAAIIWVSTARDQPAYPLWCTSIGDALYVVINIVVDNIDSTAVGTAAIGTEQPAPGLTETQVATVTARGDHAGRIATWQVHVQPIAPGSDDWNAVAPVLAGKRLNVAGSTDDLITAWLSSAAILRLAPVDDEIAARSDSSDAAPVRPTPATTRTAKQPGIGSRSRLRRIRRRWP